MIKSQAKNIDDKKQKITSLEKENKYLQEKIDSLIRQQFSTKSEKFSPNQYLPLWGRIFMLKIALVIHVLTQIKRD